MMTINDLLAVLPGATLLGEGSRRFSSVSTDSRCCESGALFFALKGTRYDGHEFAAEAAARGASALVVDRHLPLPLPQLLVADTRLALGVGAANWRTRFELPMIAVAGSNGKTTVTQMIASILAAAWGDTSHLATRGNWNNDIGLALMLWQLRSTHRAAALELGMNHPGEMQRLARVSRPTIALVNNAQREHQAFLGTVEATARENGAVIEALPDHGIAIFPADDPHAPLWRVMADRRTIVDFALEAPAAVTASYRLGLGHARLQLQTPAGPLSLTLPITGLHNVRNALAATAAALSAGISEAAIIAGLERFAPISGRGVVRRTPAGAVVIDESYNANPDSMRAAISTLALHPGLRVLILGEMHELGESRWDDHAEVGGYAADQGIDRLLAVGELTEAAVASYRSHGGGAGGHFNSMQDLITAALQVAIPGATLLVKGSRGAAMEQVVAALLLPNDEEPGGPGCSAS